MHPLAGQGLNLGLRDVAALVDAVAEAFSLGLDPGDANTLAAYERSRRFDVVASGLGMDAMNRLFSNRSALLHILRDFGLRLVDRAPLIKDALDPRGGRRLTTPRQCVSSTPPPPEASCPWFDTSVLTS